MNMRQTPKLTREQKIAIVEGYRASDLSQKDYAELHSIPVASLGYWNKEYLQKWAKEPTSKVVHPLPAHNFGRGKTAVIDVEHTRIHEPDWRKLYEDEKAKVEALQKAILVLGHQL